MNRISRNRYEAVQDRRSGKENTNEFCSRITHQSQRYGLLNVSTDQAVHFLNKLIDNFDHLWYPLEKIGKGKCQETAGRPCPAEKGIRPPRFSKPRRSEVAEV